MGSVEEAEIHIFNFVFKKNCILKLCNGAECC